MSTYQTLLLASPNKIIKNGRNIAIGLIAAALILIILTSGVLSITPVKDTNKNAETDPNYVASIYTENVVSDSLVLNPSGHYFVGFYVIEDALNSILQGNYTCISNGTNNAVIVTVWSQKDFINYLDNRQATPCYNRDMMPMVTGNINVTLSSGNYFILFSGASVDTKTVSVQIDLTYTK